MEFVKTISREKTPKYLWFPISYTAFSSQKYYFSLFNYTLKKKLVGRNL